MREPLDGEMFRNPAFQQSWLIPQDTWVDGDQLRYTRSQLATPGDQDMLGRFLGLHREADEEIASFALDFGVLGLCRHNTPAHWAHFRDSERVAATGCDVVPGEAWDEHMSAAPDDRTYVESLDVWREMSRAFADLVSMAARVEAGVPSEPGLTASLTRYDGGWNWSRASDHLTERPADAVDRAQVRWDRDQLVHALNNLLETSTRLVVEFPTASSRRPTMGFSNRSLADALALQLVMTICGSDGAVTCDGCGTVFVPPRRYRPRVGQRRFCDDCRAKSVPQKLASRDRTARSRAARNRGNK